MIRDPETFDALIAQVRAFVRNECIPLEEEVDRQDQIPESLVARMRAVLRRRPFDDAEPQAEIDLAETLRVGDVVLDPERHEVTVRGEIVQLPLKEFELLALLLLNAGRVLTRDTLIDRVWGSDYVGDTKTLDVHIKRLRSKVESDPTNPVRIVTIRGLGYKFDVPKH